MIENSMLDSQICILPSNMTPNKSYPEISGRGSGTKECSVLSL